MSQVMQLRNKKNKEKKHDVYNNVSRKEKVNGKKKSELSMETRGR